MPTDSLISIPDAARELDISRQVLHRQVKAGQVRSHVGPNGRRMVRLSEVRVDRKRNVDSFRRPLTGRGSRRRASTPVKYIIRRKGPADTAAVYAKDGSGKVIARVSYDEIIAEYDSLEVAMAAADENGMVPITMINMSKLTEWLASQTEAAISAARGDTIRLDHLGVTAVRADAEALLAAYRGGTGAANMGLIRELHGRLDARTD